MVSGFIQNSVTSFMLICVIIVFAQVFIRSRFFTEVYKQHPPLVTQAALIIFFGILSIFGSSTGLLVYGAAVNVRDLGPMAAGLICGPYIGLGSGIIGGIFRFSQGGPYMWTGLSAPILSGILGGILYLANRRKFVSTATAVLFIGLSETLISCYTLVLVTKPAEFATVVTTVAIPMILFNMIGMFIFASVFYYTLRERKAEQDVKRLELEVASKRNLVTIIDTIAFPIFVLDRKYRFTFVNEAFCRFMGLLREEILGRTPPDFFKENVASDRHPASEEVFTTQQPRMEEKSLTMPDGTMRQVITTYAYYIEPAGQESLVGSVHDISNRKTMEDALLKSEQLYRILFENTGTAIIVIGEDGKIEHANSEFVRESGYPREEIVGKLSWKVFAHPDDYAKIKEYHFRRRKDPSSVPSSYTVRVIDRNGAVRILQSVVVMIPGTMKSIASYIDITDQKRNEEALLNMNKKLNLLSSITRHDIMNQLTILKGFLAILKKKLADPALITLVERCEKAAASIESQILFTRDYQEMGVKAPVWQNVSTSIMNASTVLPMRTVKVDIDRSDLEVLADPLFEKVFYNLIDNSLRYGGENMHTIRVYSRKRDGQLAIMYEDDGVGIEEKDRPYLFERGYGKNTGFGLFLSREMLAITGITIQEIGTYGTGARFEIIVPLGMYRFTNNTASC